MLPDTTMTFRTQVPPRTAVPVQGLSEEVLATLSRNARAEDRARMDIGASVALMRQSGLLSAAVQTQGGTDAAGAVRCLMLLAQANMSVARLYEGHVNAVDLVHRFGNADLQRRVAAEIDAGALLGVWGADGDEPARLAADGRSLTGGKRFASGLGHVTRAVVTLGTGADVRLALVDADAPDRQDLAGWSMTGMRASVSGNFDLSGLDRTAFQLFGAPGDYHSEPGFVTGVWRIAAIQLGGTFGLLEAARQRLRQLDRLESDAQIARLTGILQRALAGVGLVERAAEVAVSSDGIVDPGRAVALSILARLETEEIGQAAIAAIERGIGLQHFDEVSDTGRIARDLAVYMRQVARDAFAQRAGRTAFCAQHDLLELWHG